MSFVFNYNNLIIQIAKQLNRNDAVFLSECPVFITLGEQRIFIDLSQLGSESYFTGTFEAGNGVVAKPPLWGDTLTFSYIDSDGVIHILERVAYEYCRKFINKPVTQNSKTLPRYYTDYGFNRYLIVPTPQHAFAYELACLQKAVPLSLEQQTNWNTTYGYDLLLAAACYYAAIYLDNMKQQGKWDGIYKERIDLYNRYNKGRKADRVSDVLKD